MEGVAKGGLPVMELQFNLTSIKYGWKTVVTPIRQIYLTCLTAINFFFWVLSLLFLLLNFMDIRGRSASVRQASSLSHISPKLG